MEPATQPQDQGGNLVVYRAPGAMLQMFPFAQSPAKYPDLRSSRFPGGGNCGKLLEKAIGNTKNTSSRHLILIELCFGWKSTEGVSLHNIRV